MIQRVVTAAALVFGGIAHPHPTPAGLVIVQIAEIGAATFLLVGLWTPVVGTIVACREMLIVFFGTGDPLLPLVLAALGASLAVIGPGAWSIDARLFGRKHIKTSSR
jgi:putative oxidoreductase